MLLTTDLTPLTLRATRRPLFLLGQFDGAGERGDAFFHFDIEPAALHDVIAGEFDAHLIGDGVVRDLLGILGQRNGLQEENERVERSLF